MAARQISDRYLKLREAADTAGWGQLYEFFKVVTDEYRQTNETPLQRVRPDSSPEELFLASIQSQPITVDPEKLANMRHLATQVDAALKQVDPRASFFEAGPDTGLYQLPDFKEIAGWINREAGVGTKGFMVSGDQEMSAGATVSQAALSGAEAGTDFALNLLYGTWDLGSKALEGMGVDFPGPPTNYVKDPTTGELIPNTARPNPGLTELIVMARNGFDQDAIFEELSSLQDARDMESLQRSGAGEALVGAAQLVGMIGLPLPGKVTGGKGFAGGFSPAMVGMAKSAHLGRIWTQRGLARLGTKSERMQKVLGHVGGLTAAGLANGAMMSAAYGRMDDYATQAIHGAAIAPVLLGLGAMGKGAERLLRTRKNMPQSIRTKVQDVMAATVGGGVEGYGFGVMDDIQTRGLWQFLKDPTPDNWGKYLGNMAGMGLIKGAAARAQSEARHRQATDEATVVREAQAAARGVEEGTVEAKELLPEAMPAARGDRGAVREIIRKEVDPLRAETERVEAPLRAEEARPSRARQANREGVGSLQAGPERQLEAVRGTKEIALGELMDTMSGQRGRAGVKTPLGRLGARPGDPVQVEIREGRTEGALGVARKVGVIRSKSETDLVVLAHEWSHEAMNVLGRRRQKAGFSKQEAFEGEAREFVAEPKGLAEAERMLVGEDPQKPLYPKANEWFEVVRGEREGDVEFALYKIGSEAWAEVGARKILGDAMRLELEAPSLSKRFLEVMMAENPAMVEQFARVVDVNTRWRDQGAAKRSEMSATETKKRMNKRRTAKVGGLAAKTTRSVKKGLYDDLAEGRAELERAAIAEGIRPEDVPLKADPFRQVDRTIGTDAAIANELVVGKTINTRGQVTGEGLADVFDAVHEAKLTKVEFQNYLNSARGLEDFKKGLDTTLAKEDYVATLRTLQTKAPKLKGMARKLKSYFGRVVDYLVESGGMLPADAAKFKDGRHIYVTLMRAVMEQGSGKGGGAAAAPRSAKGSSKELFDLEEALVATTHHYVRLARRAQINQAFLENAKMGMGHFAEIVPKSLLPKEVSVGEVLKKLRSEATTLEEAEALKILEDSKVSDGAVTLFSQAKFPTDGDKYIIAVPDRAAGDIKWLRLSEKAYDLATNAEVMPTSQNILAKVGRKAANVFRGVVVEYNPAFAVGAFIKDMMFRPSVAQGGWARKLRNVPLGGPVGHIIDLVHGGAMMKSEFGQQMKRLGLRTSGMAREGQGVKALVDASRGGQGGLTKGLRGIGRMARDLMRAPTTLVEHAPRLVAAREVYKRSLKDGKSDIEATQEATEAYREEMINFAKGGTIMRALGQYVPFTKAAMLGQQKFGEAIQTKQGVMAAFNAITVPWMLSYLFHKEEDWFRDLEDWEKRGYIHVTKDVRLPVPYELGFMFSAFPQHIMDAAMEDPQFQPEASTFIGTAREMMFPLLRDTLSLAPPLLRSAAEVETGYDLFKGRPIVPKWLTRGKPPEEQVGLGTTDAAINLFKMAPDVMQALGVDNPAELEHFINANAPSLPVGLIRAQQNAESIADFFDKAFLPRVRSHRGHQSRSYRKLGERVEELEQQGSKRLSGEEKQELKRLRIAKRRISRLWDDEDLTAEERSDQIREIAIDAMARN